MNDTSTVFRETSTESQAVSEKVDPKDPARVTGDAKTEVPIALYQEIEGRPYASEFFELSSIWDSQDSLKTDLESIDQYYKSQVQSGELQDGKKTFEGLIKQAEKVTGTTQANQNVRIAKIAEFFRFMNKMKEIDKQRERWA